MSRTKGTPANRGTKAADGVAFAFSLENVEYFQTLEMEKADPDSAARRYMMYALVDRAMANTYAHQAKKMAEYYGMPEYVEIEPSLDELMRAGSRGVRKGLMHFDLEKAKARRAENLEKHGEASTVHAYLNLHSKHEMVSYILELARKKYPAMSRYYQEALIRAHKGGIKDSIANHTVEEVRDALNLACQANHEHTVMIREKQGRTAGPATEYSLFQAERLINVVAPGTARWADISNRRPETPDRSRKQGERRGRKHLAAIRIGETATHKTTGQKMTIVAYRGANDLDVQLENGTVIKKRCYKAFKEGYIRLPQAC